MMTINKKDVRKMRLAIDGESVNIYIEFGLDKDPIHIAYWTIDEWEADAEVAVAIFKAIQWFYLDKKELLKILGYNLVD